MAGRAAFIFVFITVALDMLALGVMIPVLPKLIVELEGGDMARAASITGVFGFAWAAMQFFFAPILGTLSDRYGRRPVILLSCLGLGLDYVLMALAPTLVWLFVGRLISGITSASYPTAAAYVADVTPEDQRAAKFGMLGAAFGLGFIIGPAVGGLLGGIDLRLPFWVAAGLCLANALYGFFVLPESLPKEKRTKEFSWRQASPLGSLTLLRSHPVVFGLAFAMFLYFVAHEVLPSVFVLYTDHRYQWSAQMVGAALALVGVTSTIVAAVLTGPIVKRLGERKAGVVGLLFGAASFVLYAFASVGSLFMIGIVVQSPWGLTGPAMNALMSKRIGPEQQGQLQGAVSSLRGITGMIGPLLFTQVFAQALVHTDVVDLPGAPWLLAAFLLLCSAIVVWRVAAREAPPSTTP